MAQKINYCQLFDPKKTMYLIDGSSFLYRAYYSLRPLHTPQGLPVQAVYSFCRMIKHLVDTFCPEYIALVWDSRGKTVRHEIYADYKATRQAPPSDLFDQKKLVMQFADIIGLKQVIQEGVEADDLMYSMAKELASNEYNVVIVSSDKDMSQTLSDHVKIYDPFKDQVVDKESFAASAGFDVTKLSFYYALLGDSSDNIPGVHGIGKKGAADLVSQFSSLSDLYEHIDQVKSDRVRKALQDQQENAFLSEKLFKLHFIPTHLKTEDLAFNRSNWSKAHDFFMELNFKSLLKEMGAASEPQAKQMSIGDVARPDPFSRLAQYDFKTVTSIEQLKELCERIAQAGEVAIDTETDGILAMHNQCVGISLCYQQGSAYYIPVGHETSEVQIDRDVVMATIKPLFNDPAIKKYLHNAKFDQLVLHKYGVKISGVAMDTYIVARLLLREWQRAGLKPLSEFYFNEPMASFQDIIKSLKVKNFAQVPLVLATKYAAGDAHQTFKLAKHLYAELAKEPVIEQLYNKIEHPLIQVLIDMEAEGVLCDVDMLKKLGITVDGALTAVELAIKEMVECPDINLNSPRQVEDLLFNKLGLPPQKKSAKGTSYSTDQEVLTILTKLHPVPGLIMQYRELSKLKSTYIDVLPSYVNPTTNSIHTTFSQTTTATGRLASSEPNLQNVPTDSMGYGLAIRGAFKPKEGHVFIAADYSQIELRVLAYLSQDLNLREAFAHEHDIHAETAARIFQAPLDKVTHEQRQIGKKINFSILYGLTPYGLSKDLGIGQKEAKSYIDNYFAQYPGVMTWMETVIDEVMAHGYVQTLWGRRRYIPTIFEKNRTLHEEAKRLAVNTKAQGTAADIMKLGMINVAHEFKKQKLDAAILLTIHDEILVTAKAEYVHEIEKLVIAQLEDVVDWNVALKVTTRTGDSWKAVTK